MYYANTMKSCICKCVKLERKMSYGQIKVQYIYDIAGDNANAYSFRIYFVRDGKELLFSYMKITA